LKLSETYPNFISLNKNFLANQSYSILISLAESMVLLVKAHREYYPSVPLLPWMHGSEAAEHFFGVARQITSDFTYSELFYLIPKIAQHSKALRNSIQPEKDKSVREGIINIINIKVILFFWHTIIINTKIWYYLGYRFEYNDTDLNIDQLNILRDWPTDSAIRECFKDSFNIAAELCEALGIYVSSENNSSLSYMEPIIIIPNQKNHDISMDNGINEPDENLLLKENEISMAIDIASKQTDSFSLSGDDILELNTEELIKQVDFIQNTQSSSLLTLENNNGKLI
jgi:hypothetical protein